MRKASLPKQKTPKDYLQLPYSVVVTVDSETGVYTGRVQELRGCHAKGVTKAEMKRNVEAAAEGWIQQALDQGLEIPEPYIFRHRKLSAKIELRLPNSVYLQATRLAGRDGASLEQFILAAIAEKIGAQKEVELLRHRFTDLLPNR